MAAFASYAVIFLALLPGADGKAGDDYGYFAPQLLAGYFWFEKNGLFSVPWFTPAFCAGAPYYPNMQGIYLSVPQYLTFAAGPVRALQMTLLIFAGAGFAGSYVLLRRAFAVSAWVAVAGGVIFLFNGFYATRMLAGHLTFHAFMLTPLVAACLLGPAGRDGRQPRVDVRVVTAGLLIAYMVQSGMVHVLPPALIGIGVFTLVQAYFYGYRATPFIRLAAAIAIALALSAAKLSAAMAFLSHFPRDMLSLLGFANISQVTVIAGSSLFFTPPVDLAAQWLQNNHWYAGRPVVFARQELDYWITFIPALVVASWLAVKGIDLAKRRSRPAMSRSQGVIVGVVGLLLLAPILANWYEPHWTGFLEELPFFRNSFTLIRWFSLYVLFLPLVTALVLDRARLSRPWRQIAPLGVVVGVVALNAASDRDYYREQAMYDFRAISGAFAAVKRGAPVPGIQRVDRTTIRAYPRLWARIDRNNSLTSGASQAQCYEPMFGSMLEKYPFGPLKTGATLTVRNGLLNVKNPACFVFAKANACKPGDHFKDSQLAAARNFVNYRAFPFKFPWWQHAANWLSLLTLAALLGFFALHAGLALDRRWRLRRIAGKALVR